MFVLTKDFMQQWSDTMFKNCARILIVEDDLIVALSIKTILKRHGHEIVKIVSTGEDALRFVISEKPEIVLMNVNIKGKINGYEAGNVMIGNDIPIIFIRNNNAAEKSVSYLNPQDFFVKPNEEILLENKQELIVTN